MGENVRSDWLPEDDFVPRADEYQPEDETAEVDLPETGEQVRIDALEVREVDVMATTAPQDRQARFDAARFADANSFDPEFQYPI